MNKKYVEVKKAKNSRFDKIDRAFMRIKMDFVTFFERLTKIGSSGSPQLLERLKNVKRKEGSERSKNLNSERYGR